MDVSVDVLVLLRKCGIDGIERLGSIRVITFPSWQNVSCESVGRLLSRLESLGRLDSEIWI